MWYWDRWRLTVILFILLSYLFTVFILRGFKRFLDFQMLHAACLIWHSCSFLNCMTCLNCRRPADRGGVSTVIYLTLLSLSPSLYSQLLSLHRFFFPYIHPYPSSLPATLEPHCGIDRKTSPVSLRVLGGMCIMDQWFRCLLSPMGSNTALGPVCPCLYFKVWSLRDRKPASLLPLHVLENQAFEVLSPDSACKLIGK